MALPYAGRTPAVLALAVDFLADENFPLDTVRRLGEAGHDIAVVVRDSPGMSDEEILERADHEGRVVLTFDRDYGRLLYGEPPRDRRFRQASSTSASIPHHPKGRPTTS